MVSWRQNNEQNGKVETVADAGHRHSGRQKQSAEVSGLKEERRWP
jgi:hypothetical protein